MRFGALVSIWCVQHLTLFFVGKDDMLWPILTHQVDRAGSSLGKDSNIVVAGLLLPVTAQPTKEHRRVLRLPNLGNNLMTVGEFDSM